MILILPIHNSDGLNPHHGIGVALLTILLDEDLLNVLAIFGLSVPSFPLVHYFVETLDSW